MNIEKTFEEIHNNGLWLKKDPDGESSCGKGSKLKNNKLLLKELPEIIEKYSFQEIIDIGCGDINWIRYIFDYFSENKITYKGYDVSSAIIEKAKKRINDSYKNIIVEVGGIENVTNEESKRLIISKDVLVHLPNEIVLNMIDKISKKSSYFLTTNFPTNGKNKNINVGEWRAIDLTKPPFNLQNPIDIIENTDESTKGIFPDKNMSLFKL